MKKTIHKPSSKPHAPWQQVPQKPKRSPGKSGENAQRETRGKTSSKDRPRRPSGTSFPKGAAPRQDRPVFGKASRAETPGEPEIFPLNKFLAHTGLCARRKAVEYIKSGDVSVNGRTITEPGFKVTAKDQVEYQGKKIKLETTPVYILLNKPKGCITTTSDPRDRHTVMDLVAQATTERVYPVGRLDRNTSGLLLLTNDGALSQLLAHPSNNIKKVYHVVLDKALTKHDFDRILDGITLEDGMVPVDNLAYEDPADRSQVGIEIHSGRNRIVRRIFELLGYEIKALDRVLYAGLTKKNLPRGKWRFLAPREVLNLKHFGKGRD